MKELVIFLLDRQENRIKWRCFLTVIEKEVDGSVLTLVWLAIMWNIFEEKGGSPRIGT